MLWAKCRPTNGLSVSRIDRCQSMTSILDELRPEHTIKNVAKVQEAILEDKRRTIHDICNIVGLLYGTCQQILSAEQWSKGIPHCCLHWAQETGWKQPHLHLQHYHSWWIFSVWVQPWDEASSSHLSGRLQLHHDQRKHNKLEVMSNQCWFVLFDTAGIVHKKFVQAGQTVTGKLYDDVLRQVRENIRCKHPDKWHNNSWALHHHNPVCWSLCGSF
jgi:Transposase.